jgi:hypothetical protein
MHIGSLNMNGRPADPVLFLAACAFSSAAPHPADTVARSSSLDRRPVDKLAVGNVSHQLWGSSACHDRPLARHQQRRGSARQGDAIVADELGAARPVRP